VEWRSQAFFKQPPSSTLAENAALTKRIWSMTNCAGKANQGLASLDEAAPPPDLLDQSPATPAGGATRARGLSGSAERFENAASPVAVAVPAHPDPVCGLCALGPRAASGCACARSPGFALTGIAAIRGDSSHAHLETAVTVDPLAGDRADVEIGAGSVIGLAGGSRPASGIGRAAMSAPIIDPVFALIGNKRADSPRPVTSARTATASFSPGQAI